MEEISCHLSTINTISCSVFLSHIYTPLPHQRNLHISLERHTKHRQAHKTQNSTTVSNEPFKMFMYSNVSSIPHTYRLRNSGYIYRSPRLRYPRRAVRTVRTVESPAPSEIQEISNEAVCVICLDEYSEDNTSHKRPHYCGHCRQKCCQECFERIEAETNPRCPYCRTPILTAGNNDESGESSESDHSDDSADEDEHPPSAVYRINRARASVENSVMLLHAEGQDETNGEHYCVTGNSDDSLGINIAVSADGNILSVVTGRDNRRSAAPSPEPRPIPVPSTRTGRQRRGTRTTMPQPHMESSDSDSEDEMAAQRRRQTARESYRTAVRQRAIFRPGIRRMLLLLAERRREASRLQQAADVLLARVAEADAAMINAAETMNQRPESEEDEGVMMDWESEDSTDGMEAYDDAWEIEVLRS